MKTYKSLSLPKMNPAEYDLLEKLCNAPGVSGNEDEIRKIVCAEIKPLADEFRIDALGSVIAVRKAKTEGALKVMVCAHMDEIGFMIVDKDDDGLFNFVSVGGIDPRVIAGKPVFVGKNQVSGVIGAPAVHLSSADDLKKVMKPDVLRIDTGPGSNDINAGDFAVFATKFNRWGDSICAKALDDRVGVALLIQLFKDAPEDIELIAAFTVQEEVGLRGASVVAYDTQPDMAFVVDCLPANDHPAWDESENTQYRTKLGLGPVIYVHDGRTLGDPRLIRYLTGLGDSYAIPYQIRQPGPGGTDAGAIHLTGAGVPVVSVSLAGRYAHTPAIIARGADLDALYQMLYCAVHNADRTILQENR